MQEAGLGPLSKRNIDCMTLLLRSTIIKKPEFKKRITVKDEQHFLDIFNEPTLARVRGFFTEEKLGKELWMAHVARGGVEASIQTFL